MKKQYKIASFDTFNKKTQNRLHNSGTNIYGYFSLSLKVESSIDVYLFTKIESVVTQEINFIYALTTNKLVDLPNEITLNLLQNDMKEKYS